MNNKKLGVILIMGSIVVKALGELIVLDKLGVFKKGK